MNNTYNLLDEPRIPITGGKAHFLLRCVGMSSPLITGRNASRSCRWQAPVGDRSTGLYPRRHEGVGATWKFQIGKIPLLEYLKASAFLSVFLLQEGLARVSSILDFIAYEERTLAQPKPYHPDIPPANESITNQIQACRIPTDAEKALFLISVIDIH